MRYFTEMDWTTHAVPDCMSRAKEMEIHKDLNNDETYFEDRIFAVDIVSNEDWLERVRNAQGEYPAISFALEQLAEKHEIRLGRFKRQRNIHSQKGILMRGKQIGYYLLFMGNNP